MSGTNPQAPNATTRNPPTCSGNNPLLVADALASVATRLHAPAVLQRGGGVGLARSAMAKQGLSRSDAAEFAAGRQAKGHFAELLLAKQYTARAGAVESAFSTRVNPVANDPTHDIQVLEAQNVVNGFQVGIGSAAYSVKKATTAKTPNVIIAQEAREALRESHPDVYARTTDRLQHDGVCTDSVQEEVMIAGARDALLDALKGRATSKDWVALGAGIGAGLEKGVITAGRQLLFSVVESFWTGKPANVSEIVENALWGGALAGLSHGLQTYVTVDRFLQNAGSVFDTRVLGAAARGAVWAGAVADVVIATARDLWNYLQGRLTFEMVLRRAGVHVTGALGAAGGVLLAMRVTRGAPWWVQVLAVIGAGWAGHELGDAVGEALFLPAPRAATER